MSTTEPKAGEWWAVEGVHDHIRRVAECIVSPAGIHYWRPDGDEEWICATQFRPLARIPDPPAPEPTEAEKIDARRVHAIKWLLADVDALTVRDVVRSIRASDEAAGYVTVRTEGPMFDEMANAAVRHAHPILGDFCESRLMGLRSLVRPILRAALAAAKGDAR